MNASWSALSNTAAGIASQIPGATAFSFSLVTANGTASGAITAKLADQFNFASEPVSGGAWSVRVYYKPFVDWIWGGALLMAMGGGLALSDRRYALAARKQREVIEAAKTEQRLPASAAASVRVEAERATP